MSAASGMTKQPDPAPGLRPSRRLDAARMAAFALSGLIAWFYLSKIPSYFKYIRDICPTGACEHSVLTPLPAEWLAEAGLAFGDLAVAYTMAAVLNFAVYVGVALLIYIKRPHDPVSLLAGVTFIAFPASYFFPGLWPDTGWIVALMEYASFLMLILFLLLFPNGRIVSRPMFAAVVALTLVRMLADTLPAGPWELEHWPDGLNFAWLALLYGTLLAYQYVRFRYKSNTTERQQTKWFMYGLALSLAGIVAVSVAPALFRPDFYDNASPVSLLVLDLSVLLLFWPIPIAITISMLRKRLWDIDPIMNRTLVYGALSLVIVALYSLTVWYLSYLFRSGNNMAFSLLATGVTAFLFAPLKERLQRLVNRLMYGELHDPYTVLLELGNRLKDPLAPETVLHTVARTVKETLRLPYAGIVLVRHGKPEIVAAAGEYAEAATSIPLVAGGEEIGALLVAARSPGEALNEAENKMLSLLSRQAGAILQSVKQTLDIGLLTAELQRSREQLILAREEERRSMRNNLHDDIAPRLAAMKLTASLVEDWIRKDPPKAIDIMGRFKHDIGQSVEEIRSIVYDLRPPALDELGLIGAIRQRAEHLRDARDVQSISSAPALRIELEAPETLPPLPAAIEVSAYRIVTEALVNVVRHSQASFCRISIDCPPGAKELRIEVSDNGIGLRGRQPGGGARRGGLGLPSIRERAEELGGECHIGPQPSGGTIVSAVLPVRELAPKGEHYAHFDHFAGG